MILPRANIGRYRRLQINDRTGFLRILPATAFLKADREEAARSIAARHAADNLESVEAGSAKACALAASVTVVTQAKSMILRTAGIL